MSLGNSSGSNHGAGIYQGLIGALLASLIGGFFLLLANGRFDSKPADPATVRGVDGGVTTVCVRPDELAAQNGWVATGTSGDQFGGLVVEVSRAGVLPTQWEALGPRKIDQFDPDRSMQPGIWTIYTPYACRAQFGYSR